MTARLASLYMKMLRYRAALMIWMFLLLGAAYGRESVTLALDHLWAIVALASSYVCATTINDIADKEIDRVNHPGDAGRPLVTGEADESDLLVLNASAAATAIAGGVLISTRALIAVAAGLLVGYAYSAPPFRISYRTYLAPLLLAVGYVATPYVLGVAVQGRSVVGSDWTFLGALGSLFIARIVLKDFRDRLGDGMHGRPTLLLRHGKDVTLGVSLTALLLADALLLYALRPPVPFVAAIEVFFGAIAYMLYRLRLAVEPHEEQAMIGIGARLGNGLLLCVLGWLLLAGAPIEHRLALVFLITAVYGYGFAVLASRPQDVVIGYKG